MDNKRIKKILRILKVKMVCARQNYMVYLKHKISALDRNRRTRQHRCALYAQLY